MESDIVDNKPHQSSLRKGRVSIGGKWYSVTSCIDKKRSLLIPDPFHPMADARAAQIVIDSIRWLHEHEYWTCRGYVIMPDHVHIIFVLGENRTLNGVMASFGKFTAKKLNALTGSKGRVWQHGFYDHCLRDNESYIRHLRYMYENPLRKGWIQSPDDWPFSVIEPNW